MTKEVITDFNSTDYKLSRKAYMAQCAFEYFISLLVTDAFLAKLLAYIGISDSLIGIISSFISMAFVIQLMSIFLVRLKVSTKKLVMIFDTLSIFFFMFLYLVPFVPCSQSVKTVLVILSVLIAYAGKYLISSLCFKWANSYVSPDRRANYSANKEIISLISGMIFTAVIGYIIDKFEGIGNIEGGFLFIAVAIFILNICNFICLFMIKREDESEHTTDDQSFLKVLKYTVGNRNFRNVIFLTVLWDITRYFTLGFIGVFKTKDLMMSVFLIQVVNIVSNCFRVLVSKPIGRFSDKYSYAKGFGLGLYLVAVSYLILMFTTNSTWWLIIVHTILFNCGIAGTNQNSLNISYSYVDSKYISQAMAIKNSIGGICGFGASILGGKILATVQANNNTFFGFHIYGQQLLAGISFVLSVITIVFINKVIAKQKDLKQ